MIGNRYIEMTGRVFARLTVLRVSHVTETGKYVWVCRCECGKISNVDGNQLRSGKTRSCGCLALELLSKRSKTHGASNTPEFKTWIHIRRRCEDKSDNKYPSYGGRGIAVCERWADFSVFLSDVGYKPSPIHTLDRLDNEKGYEPSNVRWATPKEQSNNTRVNVMVELEEETMSLTMFCERTGFSHKSAEYRRYVLKWPTSKIAEFAYARAWL